MKKGLILMAMAFAGAATGIYGNEYKPVLPKADPTEKVIVLDITPEKGDSSDGMKLRVFDMLETLTALQGLANRENLEKVYLLGMPVRIFFLPESAEGQPVNSSKAGPGDPGREMLENGMIPYPKTYPKLDRSKEYPALAWMLKRYQDRVKGLVLIPTSNKEENVGARAAGVNACTFEGLLPVCDSVHDFIKNEGYDFPVRYDLRKMNNIEAFHWSLEKYIDAPDRSLQVIGYGPQGANPPIMNDYWVVNKVYCYFLCGIMRRDTEEDKKRHRKEIAVLSKLLNKKHYPKGTVNIGDSEGPHLIPDIQDLGYTVVCGHIPNASVTSSIPTDPSTFEPAPEAKALDVDPNGVYITFNGNDGDAIDFNIYIQYKNLLHDPAAKQGVPMAWKVNPYFIDLFPTWYAWHTRQYRDTVDLTISFNDGGCPKDPEGYVEWLRQLKHYIANSNGSLRIMNYFGPFRIRNCTRGIMKDVSQQTDLLYIFRAYQGFGKPPAWFVANDTVFSNQVGGAGQTPQSLADEIAKHINAAPAGRPIFFMARLGVDHERDLNARRGTIPFTMAKEIMDVLKADPSVKRKLYFVPPRDLAATVKANFKKVQ